MTKSLNRIISLIKKEFIITWQDPKSRAMVIVLPLIQLILFSFAITMEVKNINLAVLDRSGTYESRELISRFAASPRFKRIFYTENERQTGNYLTAQKAQMALEISGDFAEKIKRGQTAGVQIITDGRQTNSAAISGNYAVQIISSFSAEIADRAGKNGPEVEARIRNWYNPNLNYKWYLLQNLVTILALIITLLLTSMSIARERENGTFDQLIVSPLNAAEILIGKTVPPLFIATVWACALDAVSVYIFKIPFGGSFFLIMCANLASMLAMTGVGLFISSISRTQQQALFGVVTFQMPAVIISGFISPIEDMPKVMQYITYLDPIRYALRLSRGIFFKNIGPADMMPDMIPLLCMAALTLGLAGWTFRRKLD